MKRISDSTNTANGNGEWTEGNPAAGIASTLIKAEWLNTIQRELIAVVVGASIPLDVADDAQLFKAIKALASNAADFEKLKNLPSTLSGYGIKAATSAEVVAGTDDGKPVTSLGVAAAIAGKANKATTLSGYGVPVATSAEVVAGADDAKPVTSLGVAAAVAGKANKATTLSGYGVPVATSAEVVAGADDAKPVTSLGVAAAIAGKANKATTLSGYGVPVATSAEVVAGTNDSKPVTSLGVADAIKAIDPWAMQPIGVPIPVFDNLAGVTIPRQNKAYRYISLTASDSYNTGLLSSEVVSGSFPLVTATAVISLSDSPLSGKTINLINTEQRVLRGALNAGQLLQDAFQGHWHDPNSSLGTSLASGASAAPWQIGTSTAMVYSYVKDPVTDGVSGTPRTAAETRSKSIGVTYFMRIR
ncbi:hypothetical protein JJD84_29060 [Pseudomonas fluorescens]|nr:hypothetical protein [Pseudomonas fluorescens]